jgi:hypothetical protein
MTGPLPRFFVSVASKGLSNAISPLESTLVKPRGSVDSKASYVPFFRPITSADSKRLSNYRIKWGVDRKRKGEQAPALHMEFYTRLIVAWIKEMSIGKERASAKE